MLSVLIAARDLIIAVVLSWMGLSLAPDDAPKDETPSATVTSTLGLN
ncbi:MAG: hypothetical protein AAGF20_01675 [Pseudomonadota bacterium]